MLDRRSFLKASAAVASALGASQAHAGFSIQSPPVASVGLNDSRRFLDQATMGARPGEAAALTGSFNDWLAAQYAMPFTLINTVEMIARGYSNAEQHNSGARLCVFARWCNEDAQLRMRVAHVLQQIVCCGPVNWSAEIDSMLWWNALATNAFGNYRTILRWAVMHRHMGAFLNNRNNNASQGRAPSQNLAREFLQLFSMGVVALNRDGSPVIGPNDGAPVQAYFQEDVDALARLLSGWGVPFGNNTPGLDGSRPDGLMNIYPELAYDGPPVRFLGVTFPAISRPSAADVIQRMDQCIDLVMAQPTTAAYVSKQFIQKLVTDDPTPRYVADVTAAFENNGRGVRGDIWAILQVVLLHPEARGNSKPVSFGRAQEWVLSVTRGMRYGEMERIEEPYTSDTRAWGWASSYGAPPVNILGEMGQAPWSPTSVFNDYPFDYRLNGVLAPAAALWRAPAILANVSRVLSYSNPLGGLMPTPRNDTTGRWALTALVQRYEQIERTTLGSAEQKRLAAVSAMVDLVYGDLNQGRPMDPFARQETIAFIAVDGAALATRPKLAWMINFIRCLPQTAVVV